VKGGADELVADAERGAECARGHGSIGFGECGQEPGGERVIDGGALVEGDEARGGEGLVIDDEA
jgi:hypothetical protein